MHTTDGPLAQALVVDVLPAIQQYGFGDQLLEFSLQLATALSGVPYCPPRLPAGQSFQRLKD